MSEITLLHGDNREVLKTLADKSVNTCVTSPPYFGLRNYQTAQWVDGVIPDCPHLNAGPSPLNPKVIVCWDCSAVKEDKQIGLEETPEEYVAVLVEVFREVKRVLRDDGTLWLNLGDSFSIGSNFFNVFQGLVKSQPMIFGNSATITIAAEGVKISGDNNGFPYGQLFSLFGVKRVFIKQRENNFCQVFNILNDKTYMRISCPVSFVSMNVSDLEIILDPIKNVSIIISDSNTDGQSILGIDRISSTWTGKHSNSTFPVEETAKPITEIIRYGESIGNAVALNPILESFPEIYFVNNPIALTNRLSSTASNSGNFIVTKALPQQLNFTLGGYAVNVCVNSVAHLYYLNSFSSFVHYTELYGKAQRIANTQRPKQELGIPDMVKRALMETGWICRSTIIWSKPNAMPESVTDRPTKSHEYIFLFSKQPKYYYDNEAIREELITDSNFRNKANEKHNNAVLTPIGEGSREWNNPNGRNKRSVWTVASQPYSGAHYAVFPEKLIEPCILAGCPEGGTVLDPFGGSGTTGRVAVKNRRNAILIELNPSYHEQINKRTNGVQVRLF